MMKKKALIDYAALLLLAILYNCVFSTSVYTSGPAGDSTIFQQMGLAITQNKIPYVDLFDHKGIVLYWLNALGYIILPEGGLLVLCIISTYISFLLLFKTSSLYLRGWTKWLPLLFVILMLAYSFGDANYTEMWSLPLISWTVYLLSKKYIEDVDVGYKSWFVIGIGTGCVLFIRANNLIPVIIVFSFFIIKYIQGKLYSKILNSILLSGLGLVLMILFIIGLYVFLYGGQYLYDLFYATFVFNFEYARYYGQLTELNFGQSLYTSVYFIIVSLLLVSLLFIKFSKKNEIVLFLLATYIASFMTMSKAYYDHYFFIIIPIILLSFCILLEYIERRFFFTRYLLLIVLFFITYNICDRTMRSGLLSYKSVFPELKRIPKDERNSIWNYNAHSFGGNILRLNGITQQNRIILPFQCEISSKLKEKGSIQELKPKWLMTARNAQWQFDQDSMFVNQQYAQIFTINIYPQEIIFYRIKDE